MATIKDITDRVARLNLRAEVPNIIEETKGDLVEAQREQMLAGKRSDGKQIGEYSQATIIIKIEKGQEWRYVTLFDQGDFQENILASVKGDRITWDSTDHKTAKLVDDYGEAIFGLNKDKMGEYTREVFQPTLKKYVHDQMGLK